MLQSLQTVGPINGGLDLTQIVPLDRDLTLTGSFSFDSIAANALQTGDQLVSGIDFARWAQNTLLKTSNSTQTVTGNWTIGELQAANLDGPTHLNGHPIEQLAQRLSDQRSGDMVGAIADAQLGVSRVCREMRSLLARSQQFQYALGHFEALQRIASPEATVNLAHVFEWYAADYLLLNADCVTRVFKWAPTEGGGAFRRLGELYTGTVIEWLMLSNGTHELHWATNSGPNVANCSVDGLNVWQFREGEPELVRRVGQAGEFALNERFQAATDAFYALQLGTNTVIEFDWLGNQLDEWRLPADAEQQRSAFVFLPGQINFGLALSDGARLSRLTSTGNVTKPRSKRFFDKPLFEQWKPRMRAAKREPMEPNVQPLWSVFGVNKSAASVPEMKLKMFRSDAATVPWPCNVTWPKCKLGWWPKRESREPEFELEDNGNGGGSDSGDDTLGMMHMDEIMGDGQPQAKLVDRMHKADGNPEEVIMPMPPILLDNGTDSKVKATAGPQIGAPNIIDTIEDKAKQLAHKVMDKVSDAKNATGDALQHVEHMADKIVNQLAGSEVKNGTIETIENKAKQWADKVMDRLSKKPKQAASSGRSADSSAEDEDDLQVGIARNVTTEGSTSTTDGPQVGSASDVATDGQATRTDDPQVGNAHRVTTETPSTTTSRSNQENKVAAPQNTNDSSTTTDHPQDGTANRVGSASDVVTEEQASTIDDPQVGTAHPVTTEAPSTTTSRTVIPSSTSKENQEDTANRVTTEEPPPLTTSSSSNSAFRSNENQEDLVTAAPNTNARAYRIDTFGRIEAIGKDLADRIMDAQIGPPSDSNTFDDDDYDVSVSNDMLAAVAPERNTPLDPTTQSPAMNVPNSNVLLTDTFGNIEAQTKVLADRIMDDQIGPPVDPNVADDEDSDEDDDDVAATDGSQLGGTLFGVPQILQELPNHAPLKPNRTATTGNTTSPKQDSDPQVGGIFDVIRNFGFAQRLGHEIVDELRKDFRQMHEDDETDKADDRRKHHHNAGHEVHQPQRFADEPTELDSDEDVDSVAASQTTVGAADVADEPAIGRAVLTIGGVATTENTYLPGRRVGSEVVALDVGTTPRRLLVAVSEWSGETVKGHEDRIRVSGTWNSRANWCVCFYC